jgi:hypothetical protein
MSLLRKHAKKQIDAIDSFISSDNYELFPFIDHYPFHWLSTHKLDKIVGANINQQFARVIREETAERTQSTKTR